MMEIEFEVIFEEALDELLADKDLDEYYNSLTEDHVTDCFDNYIEW